MTLVVAYADNIEQIREFWPEAQQISTTVTTEYTFTNKYPKPPWFMT